MVPLLAALALVAVGGLVAAMRRRRGPRPAAIDPFTLSEPWRRHVAAAQAAQRRYREITSATSGGPLRDRLVSIGGQVQKAVEECFAIGKRGDDLDDALARLDVPGLDAQLGRATDETAKASVAAQLAAAGRIRSTRDDTDAQLRLLVVRMGELTALAAEVSVGTDTTDQLGVGVGDVVTQLEGLRLALQEVNQPGRPATWP